MPPTRDVVICNVSLASRRDSEEWPSERILSSCRWKCGDCLAHFAA